MTDPNPNLSKPASAEQPPRRPLRALLIGAIVVASGLTGAFVSSAFSHGFGAPWHARPFWGQSFDPAAIEDRADRMVRHLSIEVDATAEQQDRLRTIVRSAVRDLVPLREKALQSRQRVRELLTQTTVDRAAIEALRGEQMALADQASRRISQALADAASVLSPEQRRKIANWTEKMRGYGRGWHRG
jgi:periplasmic protein CpxP/Spy